MGDLKKYWVLIIAAIGIVTWGISLEGKVNDLERRIEVAGLIEMKNSIVKIETDVEWIKTAMAQTFELDIKSN